MLNLIKIRLASIFILIIFQFYKGFLFIMNLYETVYVVRQDIRPEDLKPIEEKFENLLRLKKSSIEYKENWGLRNLSL